MFLHVLDFQFLKNSKRKILMCYKLNSNSKYIIKHNILIDNYTFGETDISR